MKIGQIKKTTEPVNDHWRRKYPFNQMKIDDHIAIEGSEDEVTKACVAVHAYAKRHSKRFTYRKSSDKQSVKIYRVG
tara:strand:+ start:1204 stop:1434 length:231 start_codon:yes stop_codon:yes gene_type:complete